VRKNRQAANLGNSCRHTVRLACLVLLSAGAAHAWTSVGLGGGGAMYSPASSPHDPDLLFVSCDMGGFYRSEDGGASWRMVDQRQIRGSTRCRPVFHPQDPDIVYTYGSGALKVSADRGRTWANLWAPPTGDDIVELAIDTGNPGLLLAGFDGYAWRSEDGGASWNPVTGLTGGVNGFFVDQTSPVGGRTLLAGSTDGIFRSTDDGRTWSLHLATDVRGLAGGAAGPTGPIAVFHTDVSGVHRSSDGQTFQHVLDSGLVEGFRFVRMAENQVAQVCATSDGAGLPSRSEAVYCSSSYGDPGTWVNLFRGHPGLPDPNVEVGWITLDITWGWGGAAIGFNVNPAHPEIALFTDTGRTFLTTDAGGTWRQVYSRYEGPGAPVPDQPWSSIGLEVTSNYHYDFDPFDPDRTYIAYTDIGFARSLDRGTAWRHATEGCPWRNTFYQVAFDPAAPGVLYAAASNKHDIPFWTSTGEDTHAWPGGVCRSADYGQTWTSASNGLPSSPATSVVIDPADPDTLYVAMYGNGVYKTTDGARNWFPVNTGLDIAANSHVYSLQVHPDGTLFCSKTGYRFSSSDFHDNSGLWKSTDGGGNWTSCNGSIQGLAPGDSWAWAIDYAVDPRDSRVIYLAAFDCTFGRVQGGIYKTTDGGAAWDRKRQFYRAFHPYLHPDDPDTIILTSPGDGVWKSGDAGDTWEEIPGIPFLATVRATLDPRDPARTIHENPGYERGSHRICGRSRASVPATYFQYASGPRPCERPHLRQPARSRFGAS